jgi:hypothetical protein
VKLFNALSGVTFSLSLSSDFTQGLPIVSKFFNSLKKSYEFYANNLATFLTIRLMPLNVINIMMKNYSSQISMAYSNVPGPQNIIYYHGHPSKRLYAYANAPGEIGTQFGAITYNNILKVTLCTDEVRIKHPR